MFWGVLQKQNNSPHHTIKELVNRQQTFFLFQNHPLKVLNIFLYKGYSGHYVADKVHSFFYLNRLYQVVVFSL